MSAHAMVVLLIDLYISGENRSMKLLGRIESLLVEELYGTEVFYALSEPISMFRPGKKPPYIGEAELVEEFKKARALFTD